MLDLNIIIHWYIDHKEQIKLCIFSKMWLQSHEMCLSLFYVYAIRIE
jgi:hypothetical protein